MPKGVYDRSASNWNPKPTASYDPELVEKVKETYGQGHTMRETAAICGTTVKVLQRLMPYNGIERRAAIKRDQMGERNTQWKGLDAKYAALHLRVEATRGKPNQCACCDTNDDATRYEWANLTGDYSNTRDYARLCVTCHRNLDTRRRAALGRRTSPQRGGGENV